MLEKNTVLGQWREWNAQGFIPGPDETESDFQKRVIFCQNLQQHLTDIKADLPFETDAQHSKVLLEETFPFMQEIYGIQPQWIPLFFSNYQLAPWHGGCAWIFQLNEQTPTAAFLQLRAHFRYSATFFKIYQRSELIAHELTHIGRMLYSEPQFEEFFAYQTSSSLWRRGLGPIIQSSQESLVFILILGLVILANVAVLLIGANIPYLLGLIKLIPVLMILLAMGRLTRRHQTFKRCLQQLEKLYPPQAAKHLRYRLRDHEIKQFSRLNPSHIQNFIEQAAESSFRWRFLKALYPIAKY